MFLLLGDAFKDLIGVRVYIGAGVGVGNGDAAGDGSGDLFQSLKLTLISAETLVPKA